MLFNSFEFLFLFLPVTVIGYFLLQKFNKTVISKLFLLTASLFFYGYFTHVYVLIIIASILVNFWLSSLIRKEKNHRKFLLTLGVIINIVLLGYFKYYNFAVSNLNLVIKTDFVLKNIVLPVGISFFTFQQISFIVDTYRGEIGVVNFLDYAILISFFPKISAGPITNNSDLLKQFKENHKLSFKNISLGLFIISIGLFKKVLLADNLSIIATNGFDVAAKLNFFEAWLTSLSYTLQLYFDFSGYCDIAFGTALMFNIVLPKNFDSPYKSLSIKEFWNRWHMTLGGFLAKYIYIPLGGNRKGKIRTYLNLFITFFISGVWHGAGWNFILWGCMHGIAMVIHRMWTKTGKKMYKPLAWFLTFNFVNAAWVFFRAKDMTSAFKVLSGMVSPQVSEFRSILGYNFAQTFVYFILMVLIAIAAMKFIDKEGFDWKKAFIPLALLIFCIYMLNSGDYHFLKNVVPNLEYGGDLIDGAAVLCMTFVLSIVGKNIFYFKEKFKPNYITMFITVVLLGFVIINLSKISTFVYFNF